MHRNLLQIAGLILFFLILSCVPKAAPQEVRPLGENKPGPVNINTAQNWQKEWDGTLAAAKKEGKVVIYVEQSQSPIFKDLAPMFNNKYPFSLELVSFDRGGTQAAKIFSERKAGLFVVDVLITGSTTFFNQIEPAGIATPIKQALILPEVLDPKNWFGGELHWGSKEQTILFMHAYPVIPIGINKDLAKPEDISSYLDLLKPKWKGKILMNDPSIAGTGLKGFSVLGWHILNLDFFRQLAKQEPMIIRNQRLLVDWLAQGKYPVALWPLTGVITEFIEEGAPVGLVLPKEGTYISRSGGGVILMDRAPHPNATKIFLNWTFSREGLTAISRKFGAQSARVDIPTEGLDPLRVRQPGIYYFAGADDKDWVLKEPEYSKVASDIFGQFLR